MSHGYISCTECKKFFQKHDYEQGVERWGHGEPIQLINNPASWGASAPSYRLLGFSKGNTQNKAMAEARKGRLSFEYVPFKGMRKRLTWLFKGLGLRDLPNPDELFLPTEKECQSGSVIKCSISAQKADGSYSYGLKDILAADGPSGGMVRKVLNTCIKTHLSNEHPGRAFIMLGVDKSLIEWCRKAFNEVYGHVEKIEDTTYRTQNLSWVHVAHPAGKLTDPQYTKWCEGATSVPKVQWARDALTHRLGRGG